MRAPGPLLAAGRDADIFEYGPGQVLRRSRDGRSMAGEARVMAHLRDVGYPVPGVAEVSDDGSDLVMERVDGVTMVEALGRGPWRIRRMADTLARLHRQLHALDAPAFLAPAPVGLGSRVLHMDLHPLNVMLGPRGPVVIDWTGAARGDPAVDVGIAWVLMGAGAIPGSKVRARALGLGRRLLVARFVSGFDRDELAGTIRAVVEWKVRDPHMADDEVARMWRIVEVAEREGQSSARD